MRTKAEIHEAFDEACGNEKLHINHVALLAQKLHLEVLLDIRELLQAQHERETATCGLCGGRHEGKECI